MYKKLNIVNLPRRTLILGSLRLIILFMEANFLVLFALGILFSVHTCVSNVKMRKAVKENKFLFSQPRIFPPKVLGTSKKGGAASDRLLAAYILLQAAAEKEQLAST